MFLNRVAKAGVLILALCSGALAQLNQNCTVSVLNRNVQVNADGSWVLPNIPANIGQVKARATCVQNGITISGESAFFTVPQNGAVNLPAITLGSGSQIPVSLSVAPANLSLTALGQTIQLTITATYPDNSTKNITAASTGTNYTTSNPAIATISANGLLTAVASGNVVLQATNDGAAGIVTARTTLSNVDTDGDGIPDDAEIQMGLDPRNPVDAQEDFDRDGLTNLQEYLLGTDIRNPDTDGDGLNDGDEVNKYHTNPLLADTDGDGIPDGVEIQTGTDPLNPTSYDLSKAVSQFTVSPATFSLTVNAVQPQASQQLKVTGRLIDGKTVLDLTSTQRRTNYSSSNISICSFGSPDGRVFAGTNGTCTITISNSGFTATATGTVNSFTPAEVSTLGVAGSVAVDVASGFAYISAGSNGLVVVDVNDRTKPTRRGTLSGIGSAVGSRTAGQYVFVADSSGFMRVVRTLNPDLPVLVASIPIAGNPTALAVHGNLALIAAQAGGVSLVNITDPTTPSLITAFTVPGSAVGVDFDIQSGLAAVAMGSAGLQLVDISTPASPLLRGRLTGGDVRRVLFRFPAVLLADVQRSVTSVNVTNPDAPVLSSSITASLGGAPVDIAASGGVAITADVSFGRVVPIVNITNPLQPQTILFWNLASPGFGSSIAVDPSFGYLIVPGTLRILQYQSIVDSGGVPPTVQITAPIVGPLIQGGTITISANATDDVAVASGNLLVNNQPVFTGSSPPFQVSYTLPSTATTITFGATAVDYGNNVGRAANVTLQVIPDPLTSARGRVLDSGGNPVAGAAVSASGKSAATATDGTFTLPGLPTIGGPIAVLATAVVNGITLSGLSTATNPIVGGITTVGDIRIFPKPVISGIRVKGFLAGTVVKDVIVTGANLNNAAFSSPSGSESAAGFIHCDDR